MSANISQQDIINAQLNAKIDIQNSKIDAFIEEMRDFKNEMRQQNEIRAAEMRDRDNQRRAEIAEIRNSINSMGNHVRNLTITAMIGIGAMCLTVIYSVFNSISK